MSHIGLISLGRAQSTVRTQSVGQPGNGGSQNPLGLTPAQLADVDALRTFLSTYQSDGSPPPREIGELIQRVSQFVTAAILRQDTPQSTRLRALIGEEFERQASRGPFEAGLLLEDIEGTPDISSHITRTLLEAMDMPQEYWHIFTHLRFMHTRVDR